jgi:CRP-like cAMP-binding protein
MDKFVQINESISRYVSFSKDELDVFNSLLEYRQVPKKTVMLHEGEMCNFEAFVVKGCVRKYYIDENGFEVILQFAIEDAWVSDISFSIYEDKPSRIFIETLEDSEFLTFTPESKKNFLPVLQGLNELSAYYCNGILLLPKTGFSALYPKPPWINTLIF